LIITDRLIDTSTLRRTQWMEFSAGAMLLREKGIQATRKRELVLDVLERARKLIPVQKLYAELLDSGETLD
jgi:Fe2+ or Zn2+ uptake regulation protein